MYQIIRNTMISGTFLSLSATVCASPSCDDIVDLKSLKLISKELQFSEGPVWLPKEKAFIFSDIPANKLYQLKAGSVEIFRENSGYANGNATDEAGNIYSARHDRQISKITQDGKSEIIASHYKSKKLNSPNDIIISKNGAIWFTDPPFGIQGFGPEKAEEEQPNRGVYYQYNGNLKLIDDSFTLPNGLAFSNDEKKMYISEYTNGWVYQFDVDEKYQITNKTPFASIAPKNNGKSVADGLKVDKQDNVWITGADAVGVYDKSGNSLCRIPIDAEYVTNLSFGGEDGKQVLITAGKKLFTLQRK